MVAQTYGEFWLTATEYHRKALYDSFSRIVNKHGLHWEDALQSALGRVTDFSSYRDNFRRDLNRKADYPNLYAFIRQLDPDEAQKLDERTLTPDFWHRFVAKYRTYGALDNREPHRRDYRTGMSWGMPSWSTESYAPYVPLELYVRGQIVPLYAYALREYGPQFFPMPLYLSGETPQPRSTARVEPGETIVNTSALLPPVTNEQRQGLNRFICILSEQEIAQTIAEACDVEGPIPNAVLEDIPAMILPDTRSRHWAIYELTINVDERNWWHWPPGSDKPIRK